ncbi:DUF2625 domain-containing protein [Streptomyces sp. HUAS MG47]|uniref:DUF2625 domain-containing protein n=1 Tax=Streptomyces solicamelliae TaxID=3231716 RepID=UPI0038781C28
MREFDELADVDDPAWPELRTMLEASSLPVRVLPPDVGEARRSLLQMQVTARSTLGALALCTGGLLVDGGWLRVFGGGAELPSLARVNGFPGTFAPSWAPETALVVAHDVLGGVFALNAADPAGAGRPGAPGEMTYFAPDTLAWEPLEAGHSGWLSWLLAGGLDSFYGSLRWPTWREETELLTPAQGISVFPPLWSKEAHADLAATSRRPVPMREVLGVAADFARQAGPADPGFLGQV